MCSSTPTKPPVVNNATPQTQSMAELAESHLHEATRAGNEQQRQEEESENDDEDDMDIDQKSIPSTSAECFDEATMKSLLELTDKMKDMHIKLVCIYDSI
jgi:hypothetical protein